MKKIFLFVLFISLSGILFAQPWLENIPKEKRNNYNFYDLQKAFNSYWEGKTPTKGTGWKQFKRKEWFLKQRVYPSGEFNTLQLWAEIKKRQKQQHNKNLRSTADWEYIGAENTPLNINTGQRRGSGRVNCVAFHPTDPNTIYIGAPAGGFWKSTDAGQTWQTSTDDLASLGVSGIAVNPNFPNIIYIATGDRDSRDTYSAGVLKSINGGDSWAATAVTDLPSSALTGNKILLNPNSPETGYYASSTGLYKTTDGFQTVNQILSGDIKDIEFHPLNPNVLYVSEYEWGAAVLHKSEDAGNTFTDITGNDFTSARRIEIAVTPDAPNDIFVLCGANNNGLYGVYKSTNIGGSWTELADNYPNMLDWSTNGSGNGGQASYDLALAVSPIDENIILIGGVNIWGSTNGGASWQQKGHWTGSQTAQYVHADQHYFAFSPSGEMFAGNDGGIYKTADAGNNWTDLSNGLHILQPYRLSTSPTDPDRFLCGNQDNGTFLKNNTVWNAVMGGDGMECIIDYENENILYGSIYYGSISKSTDGGHSFSNIQVPGSGDWVTPYIMHPTDHNTLLVGKDAIYKTTNGGDTWSSISSGIVGASTYQALAISPVNTNYIFASDGYELWTSTDNGSSWATITPNVNSYITTIACSDSDPQKLWVSLSGFNANEKAYYSEDGGNSWTNISGGLPNIPTNCIIHQKQSNNLLYMATDLGVYVKDDAMANWQLYSAGLPNVIVSELEINYTTRKLTASTYGRGVWQASLYVDENSLPLAHFTTNTKQACTDGTPVVFTNNSYGIISNYSWNFGVGANPATAQGEGPHNVTYNSSGQKVVQLEVTAASGTHTFLMEISATAELTPQISPASAEMCINGQVELSATGGTTYSWSPAASLNTDTGNLVFASPSATQTYTLTAQTGTCTGTQTIEVVVNQQANDNAETAILLTQGDNGYFSKECATVENNEPTPALTDCGTQNSWCGEGGLQGSVWFKIIAPNSGIIAVETHGFDNQIALYDADTFADLFTGGYTILAANDDFFNDDYAAAITNVTGLTAGKTYWLQMDGSNGGAVGSCQIIISGGQSGVNDLKEKRNLNISPNPASDNLEISWNEALKITKIEIFNSNGKRVSVKNNIEKTSIEIGTSKLPNGIYFVKGIGNTSTFTKKLVIQK